MEVNHSALFSTMAHYRAAALNANNQFLDARRQTESYYLEKINTTKQQITDLEYADGDHHHKIEELNYEIDTIIEEMESMDQVMCTGTADMLATKLDQQEQWLMFANYAQAREAENVGCFSFQCNNIENRLRKFVQAIAHDNTQNNLVNHLAFFIPEVLVDNLVLHNLVEALNNPRPKKAHKIFSRYLTALETQEKYTEDFKFDFNKSKGMIVEFLIQVKAGAKFNTGDVELDKSANYASAKAQEKASWLLKQMNVNVKEHLHKHFDYNPSDFVTTNAKGNKDRTRDCKLSEVQKKMFRLFDIELPAELEQTTEISQAVAA